MRNKLFLFILIAVVVFAGTSMAMAAQQTEPTSPQTLVVETEVESTTPDVSAAEAAIAESVATYVAETKRYEAQVRASIPKPQVVSTPVGESRWDQLAQCEAGGNWARNSGNGFGGGLQFMHQASYSTWLSFGGGEFAPNPWEATREQQITVGERVLASSGWNAWPGCSRMFGWL